MLIRLLLAGILAAGMVFAQRGGGGGGRGGGGGNAPNIGFSTTRMERISEALKLTKDQKKELKSAFDDAQKEAAPIHKQILKSHLAIAEAVAAGKSQQDMAPALGSHGTLESQMAEIELKAFAKVFKGLDAEQQARSAVLFAMMKGLFNGKNWNTDN
jgi:hypothetical protein